MSLRGVLFWVALASQCVLTTGCQQLYNGALGAPMDEESRQAYEQFMDRRQEQLAAAGTSTGVAPSRMITTRPDGRSSKDSKRRGAGRGQNGVRFDMPDPSPDSMTQGPEAAQHTSLARGATVGPLGLYGQLPQRTTSRRSSPLDSPDNLRQITFATDGADFDPDVDPTATLLVYASTQHRATADLYLKRINGSSLQQLTNDAANDVMPAFSPDGKRVAFASDRAGNWDIYLMDTTGGQAIQLTNDLTHELNPSFSPDGKMLVYCTYGAQSGQWELVVIDIDNPTTKRFIGYGLFPEWSPKDNRIVFQRARERGTRWFSIWTIELVNGEGVRPTEIAASSNAAVIAPAWSPDAKHVAFSTVIDPNSEQLDRPVQADIWILNADGSGRANLSNSQFANLHPVWAKDGSIFFVSNRAKNGVENIWAIRPDRALRVFEPVTLPRQPSAMGPPPRIPRARPNPLLEDTDAMEPTQ